MHKIKKKITKFIKVIMDKIKKIKNVLKKLIKDKSSIFYSANKINRTLFDKSRTSSYEKDKVFYKIYIRLEDQEIIYDDDNEKGRILFYTPFIQQKQDIDRSSTLYSLSGPMQFFHAEVANIHFFQNLSLIQSMRCFVLICFRQNLHLSNEKNI